MIVEYHRPESMDEALQLINRSDPVTIPLAGGTSINRPSKKPVAVVDLQLLGLDSIKIKGNLLHVGATITLQALLEYFENESESDRGLPEALTAVIRHEASYNLRHVGSIVGTLISADGRSPFTSSLLALDTNLVISKSKNDKKPDQIPLGELISFGKELLQGRIITQVNIPLNVRISYEYVARTPADLPIVCVAVAVWKSGRTRVSLGGFGSAPLLAFDGTDSTGAEIAARSAFEHAEDDWGTSNYRSEIAGVLTLRCLEGIEKQPEKLTE